MHSVNSPKFVAFKASLLERKVLIPIIAPRHDSKGIEYIDGILKSSANSSLNDGKPILPAPKQFKKLPKEGFRYVY